MTVDATLFYTARLRQALSVSGAAERAGVGPGVIRAIERGNTSQVTVDQAQRAAEAVGLSLTELLRAEECEDPDPSSDAGDTDETLTARVGALLLQLRTTVSWVALAEVLGCSTADLRKAVKRLEQPLAAAGLRIGTTMGYLVLTTREESTNVKQLRAAERRRRAAEGLNFNQARVLWRIASDQTSRRLYGVESATRQLVLQSLINAGLAGRAAAGSRLGVSEALRFALEPTTDARRAAS